MTVRLSIVPATPEHAILMAPHLRASDLDEIRIMYGPDPAEMLVSGIERSSHAYAAIEGGVPFCIGGIVPVNMIAGTGAAWLLGTEGVQRNGRWFARESRHQLAAALETYHNLVTTCDPRYGRAMRWLTWLGFQRGEQFQFRGAWMIPLSIGRK